MEAIFTIIFTICFILLVGLVVIWLAFYRKNRPENTTRRRGQHSRKPQPKNNAVKERIYQVFFREHEDVNSSGQSDKDDIWKASGVNFDSDSIYKFNCDMSEAYNETFCDPALVILCYNLLDYDTEEQARENAVASMVYNTMDFMHKGALFGRSPECDYWLTAEHAPISRKGSFRIKHSSQGGFKVQMTTVAKYPISRTPCGQAVTSIRFNDSCIFYVLSTCFEVYTIEAFRERFCSAAVNKTHNKRTIDSIDFLDETPNDTDNIGGNAPVNNIETTIPHYKPFSCGDMPSDPSGDTGNPMAKTTVSVAKSKKKNKNSTSGAHNTEKAAKTNTTANNTNNVFEYDFNLSDYYVADQNSSTVYYS